jgi:Flp pilus assembly protein TadD
MIMLNIKAVAAALALAVAMPAAAFAVGSETDQTQPPAKTETSTKCKDGEVWGKDKKKCVNPKKSSLDDDTLYQAARELAYAGQYNNALNVLSAMKKQNEARVLNYKGYANRKAGNVKLGMNYYQQALAKDPNFILARSYMGMAYVEQGNMKEANKQLLEIRERGGSNSWAYTALKQTIATKTRY